MTPDVLGQSAREALGLSTRRCTARNRRGEQCGRAPVRGGFVCRLHGGDAPQVQRAARERLLAMVDPALDALMRALASGDPPCEVCGRSDADRDPVVLRAAQLVLDRAGLHPTLGVEVAGPTTAAEHWPWWDWVPAEELEAMWAATEAMRQRAEQRMLSGAHPQQRLLTEGLCLDVEPGTEVVGTSALDEE